MDVQPGAEAQPANQMKQAPVWSAAGGGQPPPSRRTRRVARSPARAWPHPAEHSQRRLPPRALG
eukprot:8586432-Alexandrium_andersonii.AAC.1